MAKQVIKPRTFFLNESHELTPEEKDGGGAIPKYTGISWAEKASRIGTSLQTIGKKVEHSRDPLKSSRYFVMALPVAETEKLSKDRRKAPTGSFKEPTDFSGTHSQVFDRLGLDLIHVTDDGKAVVHADKQKFEQIKHRAETLGSVGPKEQSRWATIDMFDLLPIDLRVDAEWLQQLPEGESTDVVIELQPLLSRLEADQVLRSLADLLARVAGEKLTGSGTDFSGRYWFRGKAARASVRTIAKEYYSVQSVHSPLYSTTAAKGVARPIQLHGQSQPSIDVSELPCVAVVDIGVPRDHVRLAPFRRGQFYSQFVPMSAVGDHGSVVASRVVFGDCDDETALSQAQPKCTFYDAMVSEFPTGGATNRINDKVVMETLVGVRGASPDVRVFNLSFGDVRSLSEFASVERREKRIALQDLDNFAFSQDCIVVVAAGNSRKGTSPQIPYPGHVDDPKWSLGPWACGFNSWICGAYVSKVTSGGLGSLGWPSPFTRIGPGLCASPVPSFSGPGGNTDIGFGTRGHGVLGYSATGLVEDHSGTSQAAPILAREAAITLNELQRFCLPGTHPFAVTARAFLSLTASKPTQDSAVKKLVSRTLGYGLARKDRLNSPAMGNAVILWQGYIESSRDTVRVQLPIPLSWLALAARPMLRLVICSDPPVSEAAHSKWACRRVVPRLYLGPEQESVRAPIGSHPTFPVIDRLYDLRKHRPGEDKEATSDLWLLEISYEEIAPYPPGMDFDPRQRVAFAAELFDQSASPVDPQPMMQMLPIMVSMDRFSVLPAPIRAPVVITTRI